MYLRPIRQTCNALVPQDAFRRRSARSLARGSGQGVSALCLRGRFKRPSRSGEVVTRPGPRSPASVGYGARFALTIVSKSFGFGGHPSVM